MRRQEKRAGDFADTIESQPYPDDTATIARDLNGSLTALCSIWARSGGTAARLHDLIRAALLLAKTQ